VSYSVGAKISFGEMGTYDQGSDFFVYEADEFDRNFLAFKPYLSIITGVAWDHHEIFPTMEDYQQAFQTFLSQSDKAVLWHEDATKLHIKGDDPKYSIETVTNPKILRINLPGLYNRRDGWLAIKAFSLITGKAEDELIGLINSFPGVSRRFENITNNLYTDYAHTPEKILGVMSVAKEVAATHKQKVIVIYEPLTNRRMHYTAADHHSVFEGAAAIYWVPSFLAREDPDQKVLTPAELIENLKAELKVVAKPMELNNQLEQAIRQHLEAGDLVVALSGGGSGSLDEWLRQRFV
jgi:UDP-N-acetylmuramate--alanine ligase